MGSKSLMNEEENHNENNEKSLHTEKIMIIKSNDFQTTISKELMSNKEVVSKKEVVSNKEIVNNKEIVSNKEGKGKAAIIMSVSKKLFLSIGIIVVFAVVGLITVII